MLSDLACRPSASSEDCTLELVKDAAVSTVLSLQHGGWFGWLKAWWLICLFESKALP